MLQRDVVPLVFGEVRLVEEGLALARPFVLQEGQVGAAPGRLRGGVPEHVGPHTTRSSGHRPSRNQQVTGRQKRRAPQVPHTATARSGRGRATRATTRCELEQLKQCGVTSSRGG